MDLLSVNTVIVKKYELSNLSTRSLEIKSLQITSIMEQLLLRSLDFCSQKFLVLSPYPSGMESMDGYSIFFGDSFHSEGLKNAVSNQLPSSYTNMVTKEGSYSGHHGIPLIAQYDGEWLENSFVRGFTTQLVRLLVYLIEMTIGTNGRQLRATIAKKYNTHCNLM
jgi:hypothetical protein